MTQETGGAAPDAGEPWAEVASRPRLRTPWGLVLGYGALTFLLGLAMAVWPKETVTVVALLLAFQLLVIGCMQLFLAFAGFSMHRGARWLVALAGAVALVISVLFLMEP